MKKNSNTIIIVIIAFLVGIFAAGLFDKSDVDDVMEGEAMEESTEGEENEEGEETAEAASAPAPAAAATSAPAATSSAYAGGSCTPSLSGKKDSTYNAILLNWTPCSNLDEFQFYKLVRSESNTAPSYPGDYVAFSSSNKDAANYIDKTVARARTYHYRMCVVQRLGKTTCSNSVSVSY